VVIYCGWLGGTVTDTLRLSSARQVYKNSLLNSEIVRQASNEASDQASSDWLKARADEIKELADQLKKEIEERGYDSRHLLAEQGNCGVSGAPANDR
jgi:hypothetical protein